MYFSGSMAGLMVIGIVAPFVSYRLEAANLSVVEATAAAQRPWGAGHLQRPGPHLLGLVSDRIGRTARSW